MKKLLLIRPRSSDQGTEGYLIGSAGAICCTMELPWRDNQTNISCIPLGEYLCTPYKSKKFGHAWHVTDVAGRTWILTHCGNWAGDKSKGFKTHSAGCILVGKHHGRLNGQRAVLASRSAMRIFQNHVGITNSFKLNVMEAP